MKGIRYDILSSLKKALPDVRPCSIGTVPVLFGVAVEHLINVALKGVVRAHSRQCAGKLQSEVVYDQGRAQKVEEIRTRRHRMHQQRNPHSCLRSGFLQKNGTACAP